MGKSYDEIPETLIEWIKKQHMFWVASAPLSPDGHVNLSPKGTADCFHVVNSRQVWYEDLTGSGKCQMRMRMIYVSYKLWGARCGNNFSCQGEWSRNNHVQCLRGTSQDLEVVWQRYELIFHPLASIAF